ncbi:hypothetical protein PR048_014195 [Dryococelus australis]|uniref:alpha-L-fucosidase n=1 Tax=Dryococelus australis TaxID=614101 RepID=A0ABQ9HDJ4_9NEOP|nr:hypothetical protein PR048_014195 [Dryococelus australis]
MFQRSCTCRTGQDTLQFLEFTSLHITLNPCMIAPPRERGRAVVTHSDSHSLASGIEFQHSHPDLGSPRSPENQSTPIIRCLLTTGYDRSSCFSEQTVPSLTITRAVPTTALPRMITTRIQLLNRLQDQSRIGQQVQQSGNTLAEQVFIKARGTRPDSAGCTYFCYFKLKIQTKEDTQVREMEYAVAMAALAALSTCGVWGVKYEPNWDSIDSRPTPEWFDEAKFGIFIHWGVYSVPSYGSEWFWYHWKQQNEGYKEFMEQNYPPGFTYQNWGKQFTAELYDPNTWADIFLASGAKYVVITSKHHEGYALYPSNYSFSWNAKDVGPGRDLIGPLADAIRNKTKLRFGLYHSLLEWYNPLYLRDKANNWTTQTFAQQKAIPELYELVKLYRPEVIYSDGEWEAPSSYWNSTSFLAWLFNESPVRNSVAVNDRWGEETMCKHGGYRDCKDHFNPGVLQEHKWESAATLDKQSWGYRRRAVLQNYESIEAVIAYLVKAVSCNGNLLLNIGPTKEGSIPVIMEERLRQMGSWLKVNGEAIYSTRPWTYQNDSVSGDVWYTRKKNGPAVYAIFLNWPEDNVGIMGYPQLAANATITMFGYDNQLKYEPNWDSIDSRPTPEWFDEAKFGIFIHWGVYSVPSYGNEWFWYLWTQQDKGYKEFIEKNYPPGFTYQDLAKQFTAEIYDPEKWADIFSASGAKYVVITSKHHEGYALYPSKYSFSWNAKDVGAGRDLIGPLADAIRNKTKLRFGLYHSLLEWYNPLYLRDKANNWTTQTFAQQKAIPELYELVELYRPEVIYSDGEWEAPSSYWNSTSFLAWLFNESPVKDTVAVNDRWGEETMCKHGGYRDCKDHFNPGVLQDHKWESAATLEKQSWGYRRRASLKYYETIEQCITYLVKAVSCNGNLLLNIGPTKEGAIPVIMEERLRQMGSWLKVNGEAIYSTRPWTYQHENVTGDVW